MTNQKADQIFERRMNNIRQTSGEAWEELGKGTSSALEDFIKGIKNAVSKFK